MTRAWRIPLFVLGVVAALLLVAQRTEHSPAKVVPASVQNEFSAERAFAHLEKLLAENVPHPAGSPANAIVGERIVAILRELGYTPELQEGWKCSTLAPGCSFVRNIIAVRHGREPGNAVMVTAHYDSVPGSAAAADDGAGVAVMLEIAALLAQREPTRHDIVLMFADAEETGLRGAMLFADEHPLMKRIGLVLNMEARGASGPAVMFETSPNNAGLIDLLASSVPRPYANSLSYEVYRRMPNDTDYSIYKRAGARGLNFAFARSASLYHSVRDDLEHLDRASLQHIGESVWAVLRKAAETPFDALDAPNDATYVDISALTLLKWPSHWNLPLALVAFLTVIVLTIAEKSFELRKAGWAIATMFGAIVLAFALGYVLSWPLGHWPDAHPLDHPHPWPGRIALIAGAVFAAIVSGSALGRRAGASVLTSSVGLVFALLSIVCAVLLPGATYLLLLPVLAYGVVGVVELFVRRNSSSPLVIAASAAFVVAAFLALYHFGFLESVFGFRLAHFAMIALCVLILAVLPLFAHYATAHSTRWLAMTVGGVVIVSALIGMNLPAYTPDRPRALNVLYVQDVDGSARWHLEHLTPPPAELVETMGFEPRLQAVERYGVLAAQAYVRETASRQLPMPEVEIVSDVEQDGRRTVRGRAHSARGAYSLGFAFKKDSGISKFAIAGQPVLAEAPARDQVMRVFGAASEWFEFQLEASPNEPLALVVFDTDALAASEEASELTARRPPEVAPLQFGDQSMVLRRVTL